MILAVDTETTGLGFYDEAFCVSWAWRNPNLGIQSDFHPVHHRVIKPTLERSERLIFHNAKFDLQKLKQAGLLTEWDWSTIYDTECMSHLLDEQRPKALKKLAKTLLGLETDEETELRRVRRQLGITKKDGFDRIPLDVLGPYARKDAEFTLLLYEHFWPEIESDEELLTLFRDEQELMGVLFSMEQNGLGVDNEYVESMCKELADLLFRVDLELRDLVGEEDFNPNAWQQIIKAFAERDIQIPNTRKETLAGIDDELATLLLSYRHNTKLYNTYFRAIREETKGGILHPNFRQWGTRGRRFSAGEALDG